MELLSIIGDVSSIFSLLVTIFVAGKIIKITNRISVKGRENITSGRDINVKNTK